MRCGNRARTLNVLIEPLVSTLPAQDRRPLCARCAECLMAEQPARAFRVDAVVYRTIVPRSLGARTSPARRGRESRPPTDLAEVSATVKRLHQLTAVIAIIR